MTHGQALDDVRRFARQCFDRLGADVNEPICESLLINDGHYCGRRFACSGLSAVWFIEENEIKLYDAQGGMLHCGAVLANATPQLRAAA